MRTEKLSYKNILKSNFPILSEVQNKCIMELTFYPEDNDVAIKLPIEDGGKILAIAIYDWYVGASKQGDYISMGLSMDAFDKLFGYKLLDLF